MAKKILIVERNKLNMKLFNDVLQTNGYDTIQSIDGQNIVQLARNNRPDLIILDIQLPEKTGLGVARMLKADNDLKGIPVIAITAHAMDGDKSKFIEGGFDGYMAKPISIPTFLEVIADFLH